MRKPEFGDEEELHSHPIRVTPLGGSRLVRKERIARAEVQFATVTPRSLRIFRPSGKMS